MIADHNFGNLCSNIETALLKWNGVFDGKRLKFMLFCQTAKQIHPWKFQVCVTESYILPLQTPPVFGQTWETTISNLPPPGHCPSHSPDVSQSATCGLFEGGQVSSLNIGCEALWSQEVLKTVLLGSLSWRKLRLYRIKKNIEYDCSMYNWLVRSKEALRKWKCAFCWSLRGVMCFHFR